MSDWLWLTAVVLVWTVVAFGLGWFVGYSLHRCEGGDWDGPG